MNYFIETEGLPYRRFSVAAQNRLRSYKWPGNVRELKNLVQRLLILGNEETIDVDEEYPKGNIIKLYQTTLILIYHYVMQGKILKKRILNINSIKRVGV